MTSLVVEVRREGAAGTILCGLSNLGDVEGYQPWLAFVIAFFVEFCKGYSTSFTLWTLEQRDWYSEFCTSELIPFEVQHLSSNVQIIIRPKGDDHLSKVINALVEDEVWNMGDGFLEIRVGNSVLRPYADGKWFEWVGPRESIGAVDVALRSSAQKNTVHLTWSDTCLPNDL